MAELIDCKPTVSLSANFIKMPLESFSRHGQADTGIEMSLSANIIKIGTGTFVLSCKRKKAPAYYLRQRKLRL